MGRRYCLLPIAYCLWLLLAAARTPHPDFPPTAHTGGFGEPTCRQCHQGQELNAPGATLRITGVPARWQPRKAYRIIVMLRKDSLARAGFELAARFGATGASAGVLIPYDTLLTMITRDTTNGVPYAHHTLAGTRIARAPARWVLLWTAPLGGSGDVVFNAAAVASNDDNSNLGDAVYTALATAGASRRRR